ncbi:MAG: guanylate kinase [Eubacterium sp.]|nr:guanylate kinase [Eubacterium sp.]
MSKTGVLTVMSGFSGAGKGTIVKGLLADHEFFLSISCTTRAPREGEQDGREYFFVSRDEFERMIRDGEMIEYAEYAGNYYGTPKKAVESRLAEGKDVLLEIEVQGGMQVKKLFPDAVLMFVIPPSADELLHRLRSRGTETDEQIRLRFEQTKREIDYIKDYDYVILNDEVDKAIDRIAEIIDSQRAKPAYQEELLQTLSQDISQLIDSDAI